MDEDLESIRLQKLNALRKHCDNKDASDRSNVDSKKFSKRVLLTRVLPALIAGGAAVSAQNALKPTIPEVLPNVYAASKVTVSTNYIDFPVVPTPTTSDGRFWFEPDVNGNKSNPAYDQDNTNKRVLRPEIPCSYTVFADSTDGNVVKAKNGLTGSTKDVAASPNLDEVVNDLLALSSFSNGGKIHLAGNTTFNLNNPITFNPSSSNYYGRQWILEGEGYSSVIQQNTPNTDAIVLENGVSVALRNFKVLTGASAGRGLYGSDAGANAEYCCSDSVFENLHVEGAASGNYSNVVLLNNFWFSLMNKVFVLGAPATGGAVMRIVNNSTSTNYGNSMFNFLHVLSMQSAPPGVHGLVITGTTGQTSLMNLNTFTNPTINTSSPIVTDSYGLYLGEGANLNSFYGLDDENFDIGIYANGVSGHPVSGNTIAGGFIGQTKTSAIVTNAYTNNNNFRDFGCYSPNTVMINEGSTSLNGFNSYQNLPFGSSTPTVNVGQGVFTGYGGNGKFFSSRGISTQKGTGSKTAFTINHNLVTLTSGIPRYSMIMVNGNLGPYTWTINETQITVTFVKAPPTGTGNVIMNWSAGI